jgi:hypothetical protein
VVAVAQLVESRIVIPVVAGSSPVGHPTKNKHFRDSGSNFWNLRCQSLEDDQGYQEAYVKT